MGDVIEFQIEDSYPIADINGTKKIVMIKSGILLNTPAFVVLTGISLGISIVVLILKSVSYRKMVNSTKKRQSIVKKSEFY